jgi:hypothetical protein
VVRNLGGTSGLRSLDIEEKPPKTVPIPVFFLLVISSSIMIASISVVCICKKSEQTTTIVQVAEDTSVVFEQSKKQIPLEMIHEEKLQQKEEDQMEDLDGFSSITIEMVEPKKKVSSLEEVKYTALQFESLVGGGLFAEVWKGKWKEEGTVAIKKVKRKKFSFAEVKEFREEMAAIKALGPHSNLVQLMAVSTELPYPLW